MHIKFMRLDRQYDGISDKILESISSVLKTGQVLQSAEVEHIERRISSYHENEYGIAVNSGTDALTIALRSLGIQRGNKVAVTSFSFIASASPILALGAIPVFVDIDESLHAISDGFKKLIDEEAIDCLILVHLFGQYFDYNEIKNLAKAKGIPVIEDGAQAFGSELNGQMLGFNVDIACLSFDPMKVLSAYGSGGMILTNSIDIANKAKMLRYHGRGPKREFIEHGYNSQLESLQASVLNVKLDHHEDWTKKRIEIAAKFDEAISFLKNVRPIKSKQGFHVYHKYVLLCDKNIRNRLKEFLSKRGIETMVHYDKPLYEHKVFMCSKSSKLNFYAAEASKRVLSLPIYAELTDAETEYICLSIMEFAKK